jgi:hypothetical protein
VDQSASFNWTHNLLVKIIKVNLRSYYKDTKNWVKIKSDNFRWYFFTERKQEKQKDRNR